MNISLYEAAAALNANARWQELISENLASSAVPGFKKQELSFASVHGGLMPAEAAGANVPAPYALTAPSAVTNFQQGELKLTGTRTDVGIEGPGFFEVQLPGGESAYTRDGEFQLNAQGQLVTKAGYLVLGDSGPIQFDLNNPAPISISPTGDVSQGADLKGKIKLVAFNDPRRLRPVGRGMFLAQDPNLQTTNADGTTLRQGYVEAANTSPVVEMAHLITAMRSFEANQRVIQAQDDRMERAINALAGPSGG
jgi:flagellar basal-body rod protein FlgG